MYHHFAITLFNFHYSCHMHFLYNPRSYKPFTNLSSPSLTSESMTNNKSKHKPISQDEDLRVSRLMMIMIMSSSDLVLNQFKGSPTATIAYNSKKSWSICSDEKRDRDVDQTWKRRCWSTVTTLVHYVSFSLTGQFRNLWQCFSWFLFLLLFSIDL